MTGPTRQEAIEAAYDEYEGICSNDPWILKANQEDLLRHAQKAASRTSKISGHKIIAQMDDDGNAQFI